MRRVLSLLILILVSPAGWAIDPRAIDILTLRLGMTGAEVTARLAAQGVRAEAFNQAEGERTDPQGGTLGTMSARTRDGVLTIRFDGAPGTEPRVSRIAYQLGGRAPREGDMIQASAVNRFGAPDAMRPLTWCRNVTPDGACPMDQPRLTLEAGSMNILTLSDGR